MKEAASIVAAAVLLSVSAGAQTVDPVMTEGVVDAPVETVWSAWTTGDGLRSWLAPHAEIDLRIGGLMRTNYHPQGALGDDKSIDNAILAFEPRRMLSIRVARAPAAFPFPNAVQHMWTVIYFTQAGADRTHLRIVALGFRPDEESQKMRAFFDKGNQVTLEQLRRRFARTQQPGRTP